MTTLAQMERDAIAAALERHGGSRRRVAAELGIARSTLIRKLDEHGLRPNAADRKKAEIAEFKRLALNDFRRTAATFSEEGSSFYISALVVFAVCVCGTRDAAIATYIGQTIEEVRPRAQRLRDNGVWHEGDKFDAWWIEDADTNPRLADASALMDAMVAEGVAVRCGYGEDGRPLYKSDPEFAKAYAEAFPEEQKAPSIVPLALPPHEPAPTLSVHDKIAALRAHGFGGARR